MSFLSKIFGADPESEKRNKFQEIERQFSGDIALTNLAKSGWLTSRATHLMQENKTNEAVADFREILEINPEAISAFESMISLYSIKKDYNSASKALLELKGMFNQSKNEEIKVQSVVIPFYAGMLCLEIGQNVKVVEYFYVFLKEVEKMAKNPIWQKLLQDEESIRKDTRLLQDAHILGKNVSLESAHEKRVSFAKDTLMKMKDGLNPETQKLISQVL